MDRSWISPSPLLPQLKGEVQRKGGIGECVMLLSLQLGVLKKDQATRTVVPDLSPVAAGSISASPLLLTRVLRSLSDLGKRVSSCRM